MFGRESVHPHKVEQQHIGVCRSGVLGQRGRLSVHPRVGQIRPSGWPHGVHIRRPAWPVGVHSRPRARATMHGAQQPAQDVRVLGSTPGGVLDALDVVFTWRRITGFICCFLAC